MQLKLEVILLTVNGSKLICGFNKKGGWSGGVMVLGKFPVTGRLTNLEKVRQGTTVLTVGAGGGCLDIFLSSIISLFSLNLFGRRSDID